MKETKKQFPPRLCEWLISLGVTLVLLAIVVGCQFWLGGAMQKVIESDSFWSGNIIGDIVGGLILLLIVHHFIKKPKEDTR